MRTKYKRNYGNEERAELLIGGLVFVGFLSLLIILGSVAIKSVMWVFS